MNNKDSLKANGDIDDKYLVQETEEKKQTKSNSIINFMKRSTFKYALALICIIMILGIVISQSDLFNKKSEWKIKKVYKDGNRWEKAIATVPKWEDWTITQKFWDIDYANTTYRRSGDTEISSELVGKKLDTITVTKYSDLIEQNYSANVTFYELNDYPTKAVVAVQFDDDMQYYVYINSKYRPETFEDFVKDFNIKDTISFGTVYYDIYYTDSKKEKQRKEIEFYNVDNSVIWEMLFSNLDGKNAYNENGHTQINLNGSISIGVKIPVLGIENVELFLTHSGYITNDILRPDKRSAFYIGEDTVQKFTDYVLNNYEGYEIEYVYKNEKENNEIQENTEEEKIMVTENTANGFVTKEYEIENNYTNEVYKLEPYTP